MTMKNKMKVHTIQAYRQQLYESLEHRADARMDLIDALLSNTTAQSVVALSLSPFFRRQYSSITNAIDATIPPHLYAITARRQQELKLARLIGPYLPALQAPSRGQKGQKARPDRLNCAYLFTCKGTSLPRLMPGRYALSKVQDTNNSISSTLERKASAWKNKGRPTLETGKSWLKMELDIGQSPS
jgi:hypothetical protein